MENADKPLASRRMFGYQIQIFSGEQLRSFDEYMLADIIFDNGNRYSATFFTLRNIEAMMEKFKETGECDHGRYFWTSGMVIVESLTIDSIVSTIDYVISGGGYGEVFYSLPYEED
jgi:hypothetical protein